MADVREVVAAFRRGEATFDDLLAAFRSSATADPAAGAESLEELGRLTAEGRFPVQVLAAIEARLPQASGETDGARARSDGPTPPGDEDGTRILGAAGGDEEATIVVPTKRVQVAATDDAATVVVGVPRGAAADQSGETQPSAAAADLRGAQARPAGDQVPPPTARPGGSGQGPAPGQAPPSYDQARAGAGADTTDTSERSATPSVSEMSASGVSGVSGLSGLSGITRHEYPPMVGEPEVGNLLRNRFLLEEVLGRGGMGVVFKARDLAKEKVAFSRDEQNYVAIKLLNDSFKRNPNSIKALGREFTNTQRLNHPHVINLYDFDEDEHGNFFIAMELLEGEPLNQITARLRKTGGLPFPEAFHLIKQMGSALAAAHNYTPPIIHSDFKPGNVYVSANRTVKVFDFGIARAARPATSEGDHETTNFDPGSLGALTPAYASLEMLLGQDPDPRDDIYALGIVAYELLTGKRPFGRKTTALQAREEQLQADRVRSLNRRQWRGLQRALAFDRAKRSQSVEQFLDELRPRPSRLPLALAAGLIGVGAAGWFLVADPWLQGRKEDALRERIQAADPGGLAEIAGQSADLPAAARERVIEAILSRLADAIIGDNDDRRRQALAAVEQIPDALRQRALEVARRRLSDQLASGDPAVLVGQLPILDQIPATVRSAVLLDAGEGIRNTLIAQSREAFSPETERYDFARANALLARAQGLFSDSMAINNEKAQLQSRYEKLLSSLDERINALRLQENLLPAEGAASIPSMLAILARLDPGQFPKAYAFLATSYASASKAAEATDLSKAGTLADVGLGLFPDSDELREQKARLGDLARQQEQSGKLAELRQRVDLGLGAADGEGPSEELVADLRALRALAPDDALLAKATDRIQQQVRARIPDLLGAHDWDAATRLIARHADLCDPAFVARQGDLIREARQSYETRLATLTDALKARVRDRDLAGADAALRELAELAPKGAEVAVGQTEIVRAHLAMAREARGAGRWDDARAVAAQGLARTTDPQLVQAFEGERLAIDRDEAAGRQQLAEAERERMAAERQAAVAATKNEFAALVVGMDATEATTAKARALLDRLAALDPADPVVASGPATIAEGFAAAATREAQAGRWDEALAVLQMGQRLLPDVDSLGDRIKELTARYQSVQTERNLAAIAAQEATVQGLVAAPDFSRAWAGRLGSELTVLSKLAGADATRIAPARERINALYRDRLTQLRANNQFADARGLVDQWATVVPGAAASQQEARAQIEAAYLDWQQAEGERKRLVEIDANKQSLLTQAKADQPQKALATLAALRDQLAPDDPFTSTEAPRVIAEAYLRLARQSASRGIYDTALTLVDKAIEVWPQAEAAALRAAIEIDAARDSVGKQIAKAPARKLGGIQADLANLKDKAPEKYPQWAAAWAATLADRIGRETSPPAAEDLLAVARSLFPDSAKLRDLIVAAPTEISPSVEDLRGALRDRRLSAAEGALAEAVKASPKHPDIAGLRAELEAAKADATQAYRNYERALAQGQVDKANKAVEIALQLWTDNEAWQTGGGGIAKVTEKPKGQGVCDPKLAGKGNSPKARCNDELAGNGKGPVLVVIPPGPGIARPFAITRYEVSVSEFNLYCRTTNDCRPANGSAKLPITGISSAQAQQYAAWLSKASGATYRLPADGEWEVASRAKDNRAPDNINCLLQSGGQTIKGGSADLVSTGSTNSWGLVNTVGNVQEWTIDGGSLRARGGHYRDEVSDCTVSLSRNHSGGPDAYTGFRLVREI